MTDPTRRDDPTRPDGATHPDELSDEGAGLGMDPDKPNTFEPEEAARGVDPEPAGDGRTEG